MSATTMKTAQWPEQGNASGQSSVHEPGCGRVSSAAGRPAPPATIELRNLQVVYFTVGSFSMFQRCGAGPYFTVTIGMGCLLRRFRLNPASRAMSGYERAIRQFQIWTEFWRITGVLIPLLEFAGSNRASAIKITSLLMISRSV